MAPIDPCNLLVKFWSIISNTFMVCSHHSLCTCAELPNLGWLNITHTLRHHFAECANIISIMATSIALCRRLVILNKIEPRMELSKKGL